MACWGSNDVGQLGDGTRQERAGIVEVHGIDDALACASGAEHTCVRTRSGRVACFGRSDSGQVGLSPDVAGPGAETFRATVGLRTLRRPDGTHTAEELIETRSMRSLPFEIPVRVGVSLVGADSNRSCAIEASGDLTCWGTRRYLANGTLEGPPDAPDEARARVLGVARVRHAAFGFDRACATLDAGGVLCWGINGGATLIPSDPPAASPIRPTALELPAAAVEVAVAYVGACALLTDGRVACWGAQALEELADERWRAEQRAPRIVDASL